MSNAKSTNIHMLCVCVYVHFYGRCWGTRYHLLDWKIYKRQFACGQPNFHLLNFGLAEDILDRTEYARQYVGSICFCQMLFFCM